MGLVPGFASLCQNRNAICNTAFGLPGVHIYFRDLVNIFSLELFMISLPVKKTLSWSIFRSASVAAQNFSYFWHLTVEV